MKKTVVVAMSGGVDSSVTALLLKKQGYNVIGLTMQIWSQDDLLQESEDNFGRCCSPQTITDARRVAQALDIPYYSLNFSEIFKKEIIDYFISEYTAGRTPNPCIVCNFRLKFGYLLEKALRIGAEYVATGHYCRIVKKGKRLLLFKSRTREKDQSYALYPLNQYQLSHALFPLGNYSKTQVREIARKNGLKVFDKPDSQEICFVKEKRYSEFMEKLLKKNKTGNILSTDGKIIGKHKGIYKYTIGQRRGIGIISKEPMYVTKIDAEKNAITAGKNADLFRKMMLVKNVNFIPFDSIDGKMKVDVKIRYNHKPGKAVMYPLENNSIRVEFLKPQRAITPGQSAVFYRNDELIGGGIISDEEAG